MRMMKTYANACRIKVIDGKHYATMPDGTVLPRQLSCKVVTRVNETPYAVVKLLVNLDDTHNTLNEDEQQRQMDADFNSLPLL